ncbi:MAG: APC family permease [Beutenbergiaceae bacterium]
MSQQTPVAPSAATESGSLAVGRLKVWDIVFFVMSAAAPLTVVVSAAPLAFYLGGIGAPIAMLVCAIILILFAVGFTAMSTHVRNAGAFYAYVGKGLGKPAGIGIALVTVLSYSILAVAFYAFIGFFGSLTVQGLLGFSIPWWVYTMIAVIFVSILGFNKIDVGAKVLAVLLTAEVGILLILSLAVLFQGGPEPMSLIPLDPRQMFLGGGISALLVIGFGAFLGFEGTAIYAEEAVNPKRTIPLATYIAVGFLGVFYAFTFWVVTVAFGVEGLMNLLTSDDFSPDELIPTAGHEYLGEWASTMILILIVTSFFACVLAFHNACTRYLFALGREGIMPRILARTRKGTGAPYIASTVLSAIAAVIVICAAVLGADPYLQLAIWTYAVGVAGLVFAQAVAAISVVGFFSKDRRGHSLFRVLIAPTLGALGLITGFILIVLNFGVVSGLEGPINWILLAPTPILFIAGIVAGFMMKSNNPAKYDSLMQSIPDDEDEKETSTA